MEAVNNPERPEEGSHNIEFSRELWIERDDFMEDAPKKYFRMTPGQEVRLKSAYIVKCTGCKKNDAGEITEVYCEYDPDSKSGMPGANRKVKGTIHWVSCAHCLQAEVRLYDRLWKVENPRDELAAIREEKELRCADRHEGNDKSGFSERIAMLLYREICRRYEAPLLPAVPAHRLLQCRPRLYTGENGVQPYRRLERYLGENQQII